MSSQNNRNEKTTVYVSADTIKRCDAGLVLTGLKSRSEFFERAVDFYSGYISAQNHTDFFAVAITQTLEGAMSSTETRIARLLFKIAVEMAKLDQLLASISDVDDETMRKLHIRCVDEVKRINGIIKLEDAVKFQRSDE